MNFQIQVKGKERLSVYFRLIESSIFIVFIEKFDRTITDDLQFGLKGNSSTIICTQLSIGTIEYYTSNNTDCFTLLLDASKAIDRIEYVRLFTLLRLRNMCPLVLRLIMNMYISHRMQVRFGTAMSSHFSISNSIKKRGVIFPILFTIYIDNLIIQLRNLNIGCKIGNSDLGVFGYVDDLTFLCPSLAGLKQMLNVCENYAKEYNILFNASKSKLMHFGKNYFDAQHVLHMSNGSKIDYVEQCVHLGTTLYSDISIRNMNNAVNDLFMRTSNLMADFFKCPW